MTFSPASKKEPFNPRGYNLDEQAREQIRQYLALNPAPSEAKSPSDLDKAVYSTLKEGEIRILELSPGHFNDELVGRLHVARIDFEYPRVDNFKRYTNHAVSLTARAPLWYTALSYTWGDSVFDTTFSMFDKESIQITSTLASALKHLRSEQESVFLWIDQICIDQNNTLEKEKQIPLMGMIYKHATSTVIWLGEAGGDQPQLAFDMLQTIHSRLQLFEGRLQPADFERFKLPPLHDPKVTVWVEILKLFRRGWFSRLWVIQEAVLSLNLYVKCGPAVVGWEDFTLWCEVIRDCGIADLINGLDPLPVERSAFDTVHELSMFRTFDQTHEAESSLLESLTMGRYAKASNAKDKVYGVLGMSTSTILPRYSDDVSVRDVFLEAALCILPTAMFALLTCVDNEVPPSVSWVPDWTSENPTRSLGYSTKTLSLYSAGGTHYVPMQNGPIQPKYTLANGNTSLALPGILFDSVDLLSKVIEHPVVEIKDDTIHADDDWAAAFQIIKDLTSYPTDETVWDAFWQTIVAGKDGAANAKAPQDYSEVLSLIVDEINGKELHMQGQPYSPRRQKGFYTVKTLTTRKPGKTFNDLVRACKAAMGWRRFAITRKGHFCLVPRGTKVNDMIAVFERGHVPFVVRSKFKDQDHEEFELIGETYVHGIMKGEALQMKEGPMGSIKLV